MTSPSTLTAQDRIPGRARPHSVRQVQRGLAGVLAGGVAMLRGLLPLMLLLTLWQLTVPERSPSFPPPSTWLPALSNLRGSLVPAVAATLQTLTLALAVAALLGVLLGLLVGASRLADRALGPTLEFLRAMPPAALVPIATLLIGYDETMKVTVVTLAAIWPVLYNTSAGVARLDPTLLDAATALQLSPFDRLRKVIIPALLPSIFIGVRVAAPIALVITLLVEILTHVPGLGGLIAHSQRTFQSAQVYGLVVIAGLVSILLNATVGALETRVFRHHPGRQGQLPGGSNR